MSFRDPCLSICAFCPNPCRSAIPSGTFPPLESQLPSAMALLAGYLLDGCLDDPDALREALHDRTYVRLCQERCVYGYDVDAAIGAALESARSDGPMAETGS